MLRCAELAHQVDERVVLLARTADPDDVVEEEFVAVRRRETLVRYIRSVDQDSPERAHLGLDTECCRRFGAQGSEAPFGWALLSRLVSYQVRPARRLPGRP